MSGIDGGQGTPRRIRVLLCDPHTITRIGLKSILTSWPGMDVVGEATTGQQALSLTERLRPHLVLVDLLLPGIDGIEVTRRIRRGGPHADHNGQHNGQHNGHHGALARPEGYSAPAVILLVSEPTDHAIEGLRAGACGVLVKACDAVELEYAIRATLDGDGFLSPTVVRRLLDRMWGRTQSLSASRVVAALTPREREVLELLASGMSNEEIGRQLFVGEPTVKYHVSHVLQKLDLRDRLQAAVFAYQHGLMYSI